MYSLNEIEVTAKRAVRGAGAPWGIAEEAGKAVRWLSAAGLPGPEALAGLVTRIDGAEYRGFCPVADAGSWRAGSGLLCPLAAGASLGDHAGILAAGSGIRLGPTAHPLLLAPFLSVAARQTGRALAATWQDVTVTLGPDGAAFEISGGAVETGETEAVRCQCAVAPPPARATVGRRDVAAQVWDVLLAFGHRTFAPNTETSRLAGAGAGLSDNE